MCPPGVDQTTRSREQWHVLAPLAKEQYDITEDCTTTYGTSLRSFLKGDYTWDALNKLLARVPGDVSDVETMLSKLSGTSNASQLSPIEALPTELLAMIFNDDALSISEVLALGLCSKMLWQHCLSHIGAVVSTGPWTNMPLICTGTHLTDLPAAIHEIEPTLKQQEDAWQARKDQVQPGQGMRGGPGMCPARQWNWDAVAKYKDITEVTTEKWLSAFDSVSYNEKNGIPLADKKILRQTLGQILCANTPKGRSIWLLRNHTTKQYLQLKCTVRGGTEPQLHVKGLRALTLDKTLMLNIGWTCPPRFNNNPAIYAPLRGEWAGHRFDVVSARGGPSRTCGEGWEDVTKGMIYEWKEYEFGGAQCL